jgi:hypothetical protein
MCSRPVNPAAAGAGVKNLVRLQDKIRNPPFRFRLIQELKLFVAKKAATKKLLIPLVQREFSNDFPELISGIIGLNDNYAYPLGFSLDLPASGQKHPPFGSSHIHGPAEVSTLPIKGVEPENSQLPRQFPQRPIGNELHA